VVKKIYAAIRETEEDVYQAFPHITPRLPKEIHFFQSEDMLHLFPGKTSWEREAAAARQYGAIFVVGIGAPLSNGQPHDGRAADYDDWSSLNESGYPGLNGDIIVWDNILEVPFELSSMGIRVDATALRRQLEMRGQLDRLSLPFPRALMEGRLPQSIGGGIGQSRLCMYLLQKAHIGEVQASIWPEEQVRQCAQAGIMLM
ncbi:MAG: aspartate--ammonia ligase, partial [Muribaculaceae bacterium]|nr:aspartate--ammonia ligase [Muribaculaceae bacterium]